MESILFLFYTGLLSIVVTKFSFFKNSQIPAKFLLSAFWLKIAAGCLYGYLHLYYYNGGDTWSFLKDSHTIYTSLFENPLYFLELVFGPINRPIPNYLAGYIDAIVGWTDWRYYSVLRIDALIQLFAGNYYSVHVVFWAFLSFIGIIGFYRTFTAYFSTKASPIAILLFCTPSIVFWTSGIHKDGLTFFCMGLMTYYFHRSLQNGFNIKRMLILFFNMVFLAMLRPYAIGLLIPAMIACYWTFRRPKYIFAKYLGVYVGMLLIAQLISFYSPINIFAKIADTRQYFVEDSIGDADIDIAILEPTALSLLQHSPKAFYNTLCRPHLGDVNSFRRGVSVLETWSFLLLIGIALLFRDKFPSGRELAIFYFALFFSVSFYIFVGLIVDNLGAIVRYRTNALPFLLLTMLVLIDVEGMKKRFF
ncbi:MAG: glycosyltransferase family 39 protein [Chitinophagales bacterium]